MPVGILSDPFLTYRFLVEIKGLIVGGFSEVTGLTAEIEVEDYREGGLNEYVHRLPGGAKYPANLVFKKGLTYADHLWRWHREVRQGRVERRNGSILLFNSLGVEAKRWNFEGAIPVRWVGPDLRASTAEVAVETLELAHQGLSTG